MEVAIANNTTTTNTNNSQHHSLSGMRSPFQREVREWQRIDPSTGALLTGRLEADRWINGPLHSYGKISDSQNIAQPNGTQVSQRKQLEVLQQRTAAGAMQVIRAQTVQSTSSRWSSSATTSAKTTATSSTRTPTINGYSNNSESNNNFSHNTSSSLFHNNHTHLNGNHYNYNNITSSRLQPMLQAFATASSDDETSNNSIAANDVDVVVDDDDNDDDDDDDVDDFAVNKNHLNNGRKSYSHQQYNNNNNNNNYSNDSSNNSSFSNFLLLDTAPSLKLSNLMKSSSSVSSNSNSSMANMQNFTNNYDNNNSNTNNNKSNSGSGSKLSLHAIVGNNNGTNSSNTAALLSTSSSTTTFNTTTATTNTAWQRQQTQQQQQQQQQQRNSRLFEQLPTFGKINSTSSGSGSGFTKSRVGGAVAVADDSAEAEFDGRVTFNSTATDERSTLQLTPTHLQRRDLESFRHYNDHHHHHHHHDDRGGVAHHNENVDVDDNDADLRLSSRHQRRQQIPIASSSLPSPILQRGRSISTDDLSTEWDPQGNEAMLDEPSEWKRVSKLRRSFQSPATIRPTPSESYNSTAPRRPLDLPASSVSVSKIRAELENGRRLTTAMRNNHVDMAALQSILNSSTSPPAETKPVPAQRTSFLTAESLKEIRYKLKKLSDESLYKEDFVVHQMPPLEHLEIREVKTKPVLKTQECQLTPERSPELSSLTPSAFRLVASHKPASPPVVGYNISPKQHTTNSLESRQKYRDTSSAEWHLRRKSYGFEKMLPPEEHSMFRMDASTDSGLGRSGELNTWSPTEAVPAARSTVVHFGESARVTGLQQRRYQHQLNSPEAGSSSDEQKRHSIAFDDSQYGRKTSQVRLNGSSSGHDAMEPTHSQHYDTDSPTNANSATQYYQRTQQKRVEFCKTEVHFAAESGRVNIVETDGKPPPTNNFRRRRRSTSGPLQSLVKGASTSEAITPPAANSNFDLPITRFGDDNRPRTIATTTVAYKAALVESSADAFEPSSVTISLPKVKDGYLAGSRNSYASTSGIDTTDNENDDIAAIRGILKNKPIKPKPYHLGENFETPNALWGVQLKPISAQPTQQLRMDNTDAATKPDSPPLQAMSKSVAERVHNVEKRQDLSSLAQHSNGYSTKINLSLDESSTDWKEQGFKRTNTTQLLPHRRPSTQQLMLHELKEHQKILDAGLKSTSLIMKTMRSASEFDEAMRRLSIASMESAAMPPIIVPTSMLQSHSYQETAGTRFDCNSKQDISDTTVLASHSSTSSLTSSRRSSTETCNAISSIAPMIAPRLKLIGNTEVPVSQQLSQLRRLYEAAAKKADESNDSADEEVKRYFPNHPDNSDSGGGTQESSSLEDDRTFEYTSSWSRLKAKRTVWRIEADEASHLKTKTRTELPKSNIMSIALHSPQASLEKSPPQPTPIARPRTTTAQATDTAAKEPLRIIKEARGARKLREHELSFFGVPVANSKTTHNTAMQQPPKTATSKRTLPQRQRLREDTTRALNEEEEHNEEQSAKWKLTNDRPDLLHHTEPSLKGTQEQQTKKKSFSPVKRIQYSDEEADAESENFYENLTNELDVAALKTQNMQTARTYSRQRDLERDEKILSEMTHTADQTMKALSDEAVLKSQRRRSLTRRNSKPLETIDEKSTSERISDKCIAVKVTRSTLASEAKRQTVRQPTHSPTAKTISRTRTSSQSSIESCSRGRSRSLSSEREYEPASTKQPARSNTKHTRHTKPTSRSSSRDSQRSSQTLGSSGDELCRRDERLRTKTKRSSSALLAKTQTERVRHKEYERKERDKTGERSQQPHTRSLRATPAQRDSSAKCKSSSTAHSSQRECVECITDATHAPQHSSSRRHRSETEKRNSSSRSAAAAEKLVSRSGSRLVRAARSSQDYDSSQRSSNRSERSGNEKEKLSRSRGHSSRSAAHSNESKQHHTSSPSGTRIRHNSEQSKPASATGTSTTADNSQTHSKNAQALNGISSQRQQQQHHLHPTQHVHSLSAATKQRERSGKDRK